MNILHPFHWWLVLIKHIFCRHTARQRPSWRHWSDPGHRLTSHSVWLQLEPGQWRTSHGAHLARSSVSFSYLVQVIIYDYILSPWLFHIQNIADWSLGTRLRRKLFSGRVGKWVWSLARPAPTLRSLRMI